MQKEQILAVDLIIHNAVNELFECDYPTKFELDETLEYLRHRIADLCGELKNSIKVG